MQSSETIIDARWVIPVDQRHASLENHSIVIEGNKIKEIAPSDEVSKRYPDTRRIRLDRHALIPGFVNAHTHAAMILIRGVADDYSLDTWLNKYIWPIESKWVNEKFVQDGTKLAVAEMIRSGTTCFNDMYYFPDSTGALAESLNIRMCIGLIVLDFPTQWASSPDEYLSKGAEIHYKFKDSSLVSTTWAPHAPYTVSDDTLEKTGSLAKEFDIPVHIHVNETASEVEEHRKNFGVSPIERLNRLSLINSRLLAVHTTQLENSEIKLFADSGANTVHCPKSNLKLASGFCRVGDLCAANVNVAIGTDGAASNNSLDMLEEMRFTALLGKAVSNNPASITGFKALEMATINGARSIGLGHIIGSLEPGKLADITAIDLGGINSAPVYDPISQIVYSSSREQVTDVWVNGNQVLKNRELVFIDELECIEVAEEWKRKIQSK